MADLDREKFAYAVAAKLHALGVDGPTSAQRRFPHITASTWSRVGNSHPLTDVNFAAICAALKLDPGDYVIRSARNPQYQRNRFSQSEQAVARRVTHETGEGQPSRHSAAPNSLPGSRSDKSEALR